MSLLGLPMYKLNLWCMIVPPLGSHGRPWGFAPWPPMTACGRHNHTPQVQFTHTRPRKDMQNMLYLLTLYTSIQILSRTVKKMCLLILKLFSCFCSLAVGQRLVLLKLGKKNKRKFPQVFTHTPCVKISRLWRKR